MLCVWMQFIPRSSHVQKYISRFSVAVVAIFPSFTLEEIRQHPVVVIQEMIFLNIISPKLLICTCNVTFAYLYPYLAFGYSD